MHANIHTRAPSSDAPTLAVPLGCAPRALSLRLSLRLPRILPRICHVSLAGERGAGASGGEGGGIAAGGGGTPRPHAPPGVTTCDHATSCDHM
eukprot:6386904-Prymnesium_polylepis.1